MATLNVPFRLITWVISTGLTNWTGGSAIFTGKLSLNGLAGTSASAILVTGTLTKSSTFGNNNPLFSLLSSLTVIPYFSAIEYKVSPFTTLCSTIFFSGVRSFCSLLVNSLLGIAISNPRGILLISIPGLLWSISSSETPNFMDKAETVSPDISLWYMNFDSSFVTTTGLNWAFGFCTASLIGILNDWPTLTPVPAPGFSLSRSWTEIS